MKHAITAFEFSYLSKQSVQGSAFTQILETDFDYLEQRCLADKQQVFSQVMQLKIKHGQKLLQLQNYVGVIFVPSGQHIEVLPKTAFRNLDDSDNEQSFTEARQQLLIMLQSLKAFRHIQLPSVSVQTLKLPLFEVFIHLFLESVNHILKRGLRSYYVSREENLVVKKGKLDVKKQLRHNFLQPHRFYCHYDEYLQDRAENRLLKAAMLKVQSYCKAANNQRFLRELLFAFDEIPQSRDIQQDLRQIQNERGMAHYRQAIAWAKLILAGNGPATMSGKFDAPSLLFPMQAVFESYVAKVLATQLSEGYQLITQVRSQYLLHHQQKPLFQLKPDLVIQAQHKPQVILDTKWKLLDINDSKYGLSQADLYQMFAYGHKYLQGEGELYLIYPAYAGFKQPILSSFDFDEQLKLWIIPFEISVKGSRLLFHEQMSLSQFVNKA